MKKIFCFLLLFAVATPAFATEFNAGFVQGLWYSDDNIFAGKTVRIYVAIRNNTGSDLTGTVDFYDGDKRIDKVDVSALDGRIIESWVDWTPDKGEHSISASLSRTKLHSVGESAETISVTSPLAEDVFFVDLDTDDDGIGNIQDTDDDGDGVSDVTEEAAGTDPLIFNKKVEEEPETPTEAGEVNSEDKNISDEGVDDASQEGMEQFLTPSRADSMLGSITNFVNQSKEDLDEYRESRSQTGEGSANNEAEAIEVNADGFGEITRSSKAETADIAAEAKTEANKPKAEKPEGLLGDIFTFIGNIFNGIYTGLLTALSWSLGHPILIQLVILIGILTTMFKIAKKLGGRPQ